MNFRLSLGKPTLYVRGTQGSPIVTSGESRLVCLWRDHLRHGHYRDADAIPGDRWWERQVTLMRDTGIAVLTISDRSTDRWKRLGYHSAWRVTDVSLTQQGLECRFVQQIGLVKRGSSPKSLGRSSGEASIHVAA